MVTEKSFLNSSQIQPFPKSTRVYVQGKRVRVPMRQIELHSTRSVSGKLEHNQPVKVYDTSGQWGDPDYHRTVEDGLSPLRLDWILERDDVEEFSGRTVRPEDDGHHYDPRRDVLDVGESAHQTYARADQISEYDKIQGHGNC